MNKIDNVLLSIDEVDLSNMHIAIIIKQCFKGYKANSVTDCLEKGGSRSETTLIYASSLYIGDDTLFENFNW